MKKSLLFALAVIMLLGSLTACGSKTEDSDNSSIPEVSSQTSENSSQETSKKVLTTSSTATDTEKKDSDSDQKDSDSSSKKSTTSSKKITSSNSSKAASSKSSSSKVTNTNSNTNVIQDNENNNNENNNDNTTVQSEKSNDNNPEINSEIESQEPVSSPDDVSSEPTGDFTADDLVFICGDERISLDENINDVVSKLGEPLRIEKAMSCLNPSLEDKMYIYDGFTINTYPNSDGSEDFVMGIVISSDAYPTEKGVAIGMTYYDMVNAYGNGFTTLGATYRYEDGNKYLSFYVEGDNIAEISIMQNMG